MHEATTWPDVRLTDDDEDVSLGRLVHSFTPRVRKLGVIETNNVGLVDGTSEPLPVVRVL
jgi:hypothetical protein